MTQYVLPTIDASTHTGTQLADFLNQWALATLTNHSGTARPSYVQRGSKWVDIGSSGATILYLYDGAGDREIGRVENGVWKPAGAVPSSGGSIGGEVTVARRVSVTPYASAAQTGGQLILQSGGGAGGDAVIEKQGGVFRIYTSPSAMLQMDAVTGFLTTIAAFLAGPQRSEVNALTRKDYVDAQVATRLAINANWVTTTAFGVYNATPEQGAELKMVVANVREWSWQVTGWSGDYGNFRLIDASAGAERLRFDTIGRASFGGGSPIGQVTITSPSDRNSMVLSRTDGQPVIQFQGDRTWLLMAGTGARFHLWNQSVGFSPLSVGDNHVYASANLWVNTNSVQPHTTITMANTSGVNYYCVSTSDGQYYLANELGFNYLARHRGYHERFEFKIGSEDQGSFRGDNNGNVYTTWNGSITWVGGLSASDGRLKNVLGASKIDATKILKSIQVKDYEYTEPSLREFAPGKRSGFVAQDVEKYLPQAVRSVECVDTRNMKPIIPEESSVPTSESGESAPPPLPRASDKSTKFEGVARETKQLLKDEMIPVLWRSLQQAWAKIEELEGDLEDLRLQVKKATTDNPRKRS